MPPLECDEVITGKLARLQGRQRFGVPETPRRRRIVPLVPHFELPHRGRADIYQLLAAALEAHFQPRGTIGEREQFGAVGADRQAGITAERSRRGAQHQPAAPGQLAEAFTSGIGLVENQRSRLDPHIAWPGGCIARCQWEQ